MPCNDWSVGDVQRHEAEKRATELAAKDEQITALQARNDELARMLCGLCKETYDQDVTFPKVEGLEKWWKQHQAVDRHRDLLGQTAYDHALALGNINGLPWEKLTDAQRGSVIKAQLEYQDAAVEMVAAFNGVKTV